MAKKKTKPPIDVSQFWPTLGSDEPEDAPEPKAGPSVEELLAKIEALETQIRTPVVEDTTPLAPEPDTAGARAAMPMPVTARKTT
jgi:hypothetical protein